MNDLNIHSRPVIPDRIQITVTPDFIYTKTSEKYKDYPALIDFNRQLCLYDKDIVRSGKFYYFIKLPYDHCIPYVSNVRISRYNPYSVSFQLNFIRLIRYFIDCNSEFRVDYDTRIYLDEDNYINYEVWPYWDNNLIYELLNGLYDRCIALADYFMKKLLFYHKIEYEKVTVSQIETNIDYYVGLNLIK